MHDIHWSEGMLLLPQHLQVFRSFLLERAEHGAQRSGVGRYGVRSLEWGVTADAVEVRAVDLTFPSGAVLRIPEESTVVPAPLRDAMAAARGELDVYIGVPYAQEGVSVVASDDNRGGRYRVQGVQIRDEVDPSQRSEREVLIRRLNARIFLGDDEDERRGYECVLVARVGRGTNMEPEASDSYVPPLLDVTASVPLQRRLSALCAVARKHSETLGEDLSSRPFTLAQQTGTDPTSILKLHALNTELGSIEQLCLTQGVHPFDTYLALCRLAGSLSLFSGTRRCPQLPPYDHERLVEGFSEVCGLIESMLGGVVPHHFVEREFEHVDGKELCRLDGDWVEHGSQLYLGVVRGDHSPEELGQIVGTKVKIFAGDASARPGLRGVALIRMDRCPAALPDRDGQDYFHLDPNASGSRYWDPVCIAKSVQLFYEDVSARDLEIRLFAVPKR